MHEAPPLHVLVVVALHDARPVALSPCHAITRILLVSGSMTAVALYIVDLVIAHRPAGL